METPNLHIHNDRPLKIGHALLDDKLDRVGFATSIVQVLNTINHKSSLVVSIEGDWGSGKTSTLAMIEELLESQSKSPIIVNFNPWLIGDRDALLRLFLGNISSEINLTDHSKSGKKAAKEIASYAKIFDVIGFIPGAEPWASIVKGIISSVGAAAGDISELKTPDIESQKNKVEEALRKFSRPIIVFIDDMDRLFPQEVFEMIRIIKAVGDLPNIGYVLAWDSRYIRKALESAHIPHSETYLDKIVQVRMPLPNLSSFANETLVNDALDKLPIEALQTYFTDDKNRLHSLYYYGLRDLLKQPRDISRLFNTVAIIEPGLRGEIVFSDILGLAALMVHGSAVFELLKNNPRLFIGRLSKDISIEKTKDIIESGKKSRDLAYKNCKNSEAIRNIVSFLFPLTAKANSIFSLENISEINGHLAAPARLMIALQMSVSSTDVSFKSARTFLLHPLSREKLEQDLTDKNGLDFLEKIGEIATTMNDLSSVDLQETCLSISRIVDKIPFVNRTEERRFMSLPTEYLAETSIKKIVAAIDTNKEGPIAAAIVQDIKSLTVAVEIMANNYLRDNERYPEKHLKLPDDAREHLSEQLAKNVLHAAQANKLFNTSNPAYMLWVLARLSPDYCYRIFGEIQTHDKTLDSFALQIFKTSYDSHKGQSYSRPIDITVLEAYCPLDKLIAHAKERLRDESLIYPTKAAWRSLIEDKAIYGIDGSLQADR